MKERKSFLETAMAHHRIVLLLVGMLVLTGLVGLYLMPKQEMPAFTIREGAVVAVYPGATSSQIEERVTKPLENFLFGYKEVNKKKTYSVTKDGMVIVYLQLNDDISDRDAFWSKFKHGLDAFKSQLPSGVLALMAEDDIGDTSTLLITLESRQKTYRELETYMSSLEDRLRRIDAISRLRTFGEQKEQISVYLDQNKMSQYGIGAYTILNNLALRGFTTMSGSVNNDQLHAPIHIADTYNGERDVAEQIVYSAPDGSVVRLKDVARVTREYPKPDKYITNNGKKCLLLSVEMRSGNNIIELGKDLNKTLDEFKQTLPKDVQIYKITDQSKVVSDSVNVFLRELLTAVVSVLIVVVLLMPIRVAGVSALSIPITIFMALGMFFLFKIELNTVTLAALIVTLGMVVDDSMVIIDNYMEKLGEGMSRWHASVAAPQEFFMSVLSATLSISITFFPFLITMKGNFRDFVSSFPWAITIILGISLLVSLLVTPYLQYIFIRKGITLQQKGRKKTPLDYMLDAYRKLLAACFKHPYITLSTGVLLIVVGIVIASRLPQRLMPLAERNQLAVEFYLPEGTAAQKTAQVADSLEHILRRDSRVVSVTSFIGQGSPRFHTTYAPQVGGTNFAQFIVNTKDNEATEELMKEYADKYSDYFPEAYVRFKQMDYSDAVYPVEFRLSGDSISDLLRAANQVEAVMHKNPAFRLIRTNYAEPRPGVSVKMKETEANRLGVDKAILSADLAILNGEGIPMATTWQGDYPLSVVLKSEYDGRTPGFKDLPEEYIPVLGGVKSVPLRQVADVKPDWTNGSIVRRNGVRTVSVVAEVRQGKNVDAESNKTFAELKKLKLPDSVQLTQGGMFERDTENQPQIMNGLLISVLIIFFILLFHFKKIGLALLNLSSITLCVFGAFLGLWLVGKEISLTAILGLVSLMGILVRNGIIMLDYAQELREKEGMTVKDAAFHSGVRRMRPILLTSLAASVGVLPMIIENSYLWSPMGTIIFFGTLISMVLISTMLPVAYWLSFRKLDKTAVR